MGSAPSTCTIYIVYRHALFAQGIRSLLRGRRAMRVVGMESDMTKAVEAVGSLRPEVIIVEESDAGAQSPTLGAILERHPAGRVVALDLAHNFATVYDRHRVVTTQPADLVRAIRGFPRDRGDPGSGRTRRTARGDHARDEISLPSSTRRGQRR